MQINLYAGDCSHFYIAPLGSIQHDAMLAMGVGGRVTCTTHTSGSNDPSPCPTHTGMTLQEIQAVIAAD